MKKKSPEAILRGHSKKVNALAITQDNKKVVSAGLDNTLRIWNLEKRRQEAIFRDENYAKFSISITHDDKYIISGGRDKTIKIWNIAEKHQEPLANGHNSPVKCITNMLYHVVGIAQ